jgi:hypothetical protein
MPKLHHLLLQGPLSHPPPSTTPMAPTRVTPLIKRQVVAAAMEMKLACFSLSCQGGACMEACFKENFNGCALLHHKFFYKEEW